MILHDSHSPDFREPLSPVCAGGALTLRIYCDEASAVTVRTWNGCEARTAMKALDGHMFEATIIMPDTPMLLWYDFIAHTPEGDVHYGNAEDQLGGAGAVFHGMPRSYQVTVYDPDYHTPDYLRKGVIYQIFPDRFYCKSRRMGAARKEAVAQAHPDAVFHESWDERPLLNLDPANGDNQATDFFCGTLSGVTEKLDYLQALGVSVLYLNPIVRAHTNHRYDTGDYEHVDPILGSDADFTTLTREARKRGMQVLCDGVFSHTGADSRYFNRYGRYDTLGAYQSKQSPYYDWYSFDEYPDRYNSWWGFYTLPAVNKDNAAYRDYLLNADTGALPLWMKRGACGWRLDVADELPVDLLQQMRQAVKRQNPNGTLLGEVWEDASNKVSYGRLRSYCLGDTLDSVMNYPLRRAIIDFFTHKVGSEVVAKLILHQREVYPAPFFYALMNLLGSHDRVRILNAMAGYDREGAIQMPRDEAAKVELTDEQLSKAKDRYLEAVKLLCAIPGAPTIYYGDEMGMQGMADPWNRAPMEWNHGDAVLWSSISTLLNRRQSQRVLQTGFLSIEVPDDDTLIIKRFARDGKDVFGDPLDEDGVCVTITRNGK